MAGDTSPKMPLASTTPMGPRMTSARAALYTTAFSPVAPWAAPAFSMAAVAATLVPTQRRRQSPLRRGFSSFTSRLPTPPP